MSNGSESDKVSGQLEHALIDLLIPTLRKSMLTSVISVIVFGSMLVAQAPVGLALWSLLRLAASGAIWILLQRVATSEKPSRQRLSSIIALMTASAAVWGAIPLVVRPELPQWRAVVALWIFGHQAVSTVICAADAHLSSITMATVTTIATLGFITTGDRFGLVLGLIVLLGGFYSTMLARGLTNAMLAGVRGQLAAAEMAASLAERHVELEASNRRLHQLAGTDELTNLANRRSFYQHIAPHGFTVQSGWIGLIDVDRFKHINDSYGHNVGDEILRLLTDRWREVLGGRLLGRLGGDEFGFAAFDLTGMEPQLLADRLVLASDSIFRIDQQSIPTTISLGIAPFSANDPLAEVLDAADRALYEAKSLGRNRLAIAQHTVSRPLIADTTTHQDLLDPFIELQMRLATQ
jgi:diguanylate cyclase (GGDEF)-like protein